MTCAKMRLRLLAGLLCALLVACGETEPPAPPAAGTDGEVAPPAAEEVSPSPPAPVAPTVPEPDAEEPPPVAVPEPQAVPPPTPVEPETPEAPAPPPQPAVDLATLEKRLRKTDALGVLTKLALKNEIDDFVEAMDALHSKGQGQLPELRERFDLLVMKLMSLLQDDAPSLANEIASSREHLWQLLADPREFARLST
jgi:hypothetical protein